MRLTFEGSEQLAKKLEAAGRNAVRDLARALNVEAERIMTESKNEAPVDVGVLRASGVVHSPDIRGTHAEVILGYGGAASDYALVQHERTDFHHTSGKAKFLSDPVKRHAQGFGNRLADNLDLF